MGKIEVNEEIAASADAVWERIGDFSAITSWMDGVDGCEVQGEGVGAVRTIALGPARITERLEAFDPQGRSFSYTILEGRLPVRNYLATVTVLETAPGACRVDWNARYDLPEGVAEEAVGPRLEEAYGGALRGLKRRMEG